MSFVICCYAMFFRGTGGPPVFLIKDTGRACPCHAKSIHFNPNPRALHFPLQHREDPPVGEDAYNDHDDP